MVVRCKFSFAFRQTVYPTSPVKACDQTSPLKKKEKKGKKTKAHVKSRSGKAGQLSTDVNGNTVITHLEEVCTL